MSLLDSLKKLKPLVKPKSSQDKPISFISPMHEHSTNRRCSECMKNYGLNYVIQRASYYGYSKNTNGGPNLSSRRTLCSAHKEMLHHVTTISTAK